VVNPRPAPAFLAVPVFGLHAKVGPGRLDEAHVGDAVVACDLEGPHPLLAGVGGERTAQHRRIIGEDHAFDAGDDADADDRAAANGVVRVVRGERTDLEEGAVRVEDVREALAYGELAALGQTLVVGGASAGFRLVEQPIDLRQLLQHRGPVLDEGVGARIEARSEARGEERLHRVSHAVAGGGALAVGGEITGMVMSVN